MKKILALVLALVMCIGCASAFADKVGVSMPTKDLQRWNQDGEYMEKLLGEAGYEVELQYASNDVPTQLNQVETMIDDGCAVIVIAAIEGSSLGAALDKAAEKGVKVIAYDRLLMDNANVDYLCRASSLKKPWTSRMLKAPSLSNSLPATPVTTTRASSSTALCPS